MPELEPFFLLFFPFFWTYPPKLYRLSRWRYHCTTYCIFVLIHHCIAPDWFLSDPATFFFLYGIISLAFSVFSLGFLLRVPSGKMVCCSSYCFGGVFHVMSFQQCPSGTQEKFMLGVCPRHCLMLGSIVQHRGATPKSQARTRTCRMLRGA